MYLLINSTDPEVIGREAFQIQKIPEYDYYAEKSIRWINFDKFIDYEPYLKSFIVNYRSKLTDMLSHVSNAFLITEKLLNIFLHSNIEHYQFFEANVIHRNKNYKYYFFFIYGQDYSLVDYQNMIFYGISNAPYSDFYREPHEREGVKKKEIKVETPSQIINWQKLYPDYPNREYEALKLNHANIHTDMIRLPLLLSGGYFVNEVLKNKIIEAKCTGVNFRTKDWQERTIL